MTRASQCSIARYPELNPISPVMPTSYGLSYSTNSLPRNACTTGAFSAAASSMSWSCAPAQPAPARIVTRLAEFSPSAAAASDWSSGRMTGDTARTGTASVSGASARKISPGTTTTLTPPRCSAIRIAMSRVRGSCPEMLTSSQYTALAKQQLGMGLLEVLPADLLGRDLRRDRQHRHIAAVGVEQPVDQVQVARPAAPGAHGQLPGHRRLGGGREPGGLLMPNVLPGDLAVPAQRIGKAVQRVPGDPVPPPAPRRLQ